MVESSLQAGRQRPRSRVARASRWALSLALLTALGIYALPRLWLFWHQFPARSLTEGAPASEVNEALGPADVRLPLDPSDPEAAGLAECWIWFWPEDPLRKVCKRLPFAPDSSAFDLEERGSAMVSVFFDHAKELQSIELE